jgi:transposase
MEWTVAIAVDTHKDVHVAVALDGPGPQLDSREIATTPAGYRSLLSWAQELGVPAFAIEGTGSYGAGLVRFLERAGVSVYECERARRQEHRRGKSDLLDAALAARRQLGGDGLSFPRGGGRREDLRLVLLERRSAMRARNAALNQLSALLVTAPDHLRARLGALSGDRLAHASARLRPRPEVVIGVFVGSGNAPCASHTKWPRPSAHWLRSSPRRRLICSRSAASDRSAAPSCSSRAATRAG